MRKEVWQELRGSSGTGVTHNQSPKNRDSRPKAASLLQSASHQLAVSFKTQSRTGGLLQGQTLLTCEQVAFPSLPFQKQSSHTDYKLKNKKASNSVGNC